jgi:hypothetical protein
MQAGKQTGRQTERQAGMFVGRQTDRQTGKPIDRQTDRPTNRLTAGQSAVSDVKRYAQMIILMAGFKLECMMVDKTDQQANRQAGKQTGRQAGRQRVRQSCFLVGRQTSRWADGCTCGQPSRVENGCERKG